MPYLTMSPVLHDGMPRLDVATEYYDKELVKDCPGTYWDKKRKTWHCPRTLAAVYQMRGIFGNRLDYDDEVEAWIRPEKERMEYARYLCRLLSPVEQTVVASGHRIDEEPEISCDLSQTLGRRARSIGVGRPRTQVALGEPAHGFDDQLLIVIECEVHDRSRTAIRKNSQLRL